MSNKPLSILHLDDSPFELERVKHALEEKPVIGRFRVESLCTASDYRARIARGPRPDAVLLDIDLDDPTANGITLAQETRNLFPQTVILFCSSSDDAATIGSGFSAGGDDFISKRSDAGALSLRIFQSFQLAALKRMPDAVLPLAQARSQPARPQPTVVGRTLRRIKKRVPLLLDSEVGSVYVEGESGTGKEVVADLVEASLPPGTPFVRVNCAAITPSLMESELFGHKKGAFTGAMLERRGLLEGASGGWIFLDEVSALTASAQAALLRALENREIRRVGETTVRKIEIRILSASNEPLSRLVQQERFRNDLLQRLSEAEIRLPALHERPDEIEEFVKHFCKSLPGGPYEISQPALEVLCRCAWSEGNVRELRNVVKAMTELKMHKLLTPLSIPERVWERLRVDERATSRPGSTNAGRSAGATALEIKPPWKRSGLQLSIPLPPNGAPSFDSLCDHLLLEVIRHYATNDGDVSLRSLARRLDLSRDTMSKRLKRLAAKHAASQVEIGHWLGRGQSHAQ